MIISDMEKIVIKKNCKPKILSVYWGFALGGGVRHACVLHEIQHHYPVQIVHVCIRSEKWDSDVDSLLKINAKNIFIKSRFDFRWMKKLASLIKVSAPDAIMTHGFNGHFAVLMSSFFIKNNTIPKICSYHGRYHPPQKNRIIFSRILNEFTEYFIQNKARSTVTVSEFSKNTLVFKGVDPAKISVVYNGLDTNVSFSKLSRINFRRNWGVKEGELLVGTVSRLDVIKGISFLLRALRRLIRIGLPLKLVIIGTGPLEKSLRDDVRRYGLEKKVFFTGNRSDIDDCLQAIDVYALPSLEENHSIALLEAMRSGKTIIATNVGGNGESVRNGIEALLVPPMNVDALANALEMLYRNTYLAEKLGRNASERFVREFSLGKTLNDTYDWMIKAIQ